MVHGLNGHWRDTWTAGDQLFWLKDLLPELVPNARIFSWGYDSRTHGSTPVSEEFIWGHGINLVSDLTLERDATNVRSICPLLVLPLIGSRVYDVRSFLSGIVSVVWSLRAYKLTR